MKKQKDAAEGKKKTKSAKQVEEEENCQKGATEDYFRDMGIYGTSNFKRSTSHFLTNTGKDRLQSFGGIPKWFPGRR